MGRNEEGPQESSLGDGATPCSLQVSPVILLSSVSKLNPQQYMFNVLRGMLANAPMSPEIETRKKVSGW